MTRWKLTVEYKGTDFSGWQRQKGVPTVQQTIEEAITKFCQRDIRIQGAGRTDAGVHACGQVCHFDLDYGDRPMTAYNLAKAINAHIRPQLVSIIKAEEVDSEFHARFHAVNKLYRYRVICRRSPPTIDNGLAWHFRRPLDVAAMTDASDALLGDHDFTTFRDSNCQAKSPLRSLKRLDVTARDYDGCGGTEIIFETEAPSFLHHQVRNMVGTLTLVGEGKWTKDDVAAALAARDRTKGGPTAPSDGLYLMRVDYE